MLLTLVIILILIWAAVVGSLYSNFLVFYQNFTETENYHKARYASIAATERAELVIKQRKPWYIWSWWWILGENWSTGWFAGSDQIISDFSYLSNDNSSVNKSTIFWDINSRTTRIPKENQWNVDKLLATWDSLNYNAMDYENAEIFLLYYDKSADNPYKKTDCNNILSCEKSNLSSISWSIRLPPLIYETFGDLDDNHSLFQEWWYKDDALVDRQLKWNFNGTPFTVFATQRAAWAEASNEDSAIRESNLNDWVNLLFNNARWDPRRVKNPHLPTIISQSYDTIIEQTNTSRFNTMFSDDHFSDLQLRFGLLNLVLWKSDTWRWTISKRYPYVEYYLDFWGIVSDKYYTIKTEWNYGDYKIDTVIYKPTIVESILRSFTTIL